MGPLVTSCTVLEYFTSVQTYKYLRYAVLLPVYELPGVFVGNPTNLVNGFLWTIILECICYVGIWIAFKCKMLNQKVLKWIIPVAFIICVGIFVIKPAFIYQCSGYIRPLFCFLAGVIFYVFQDKIVIKARYRIVTVLMLVTCCCLGYANMGIILFLPYIVGVLLYYFVEHPIARKFR